ncbi:MAG: gamma-glutamyl-gamma-aminobutyrate hydrolase family protein [Cloacibacillus sp.]
MERAERLESDETMKPLIGIATAPFRHAFASKALSEVESDVLEYFWLLSRLTEKIISGVRVAGGLPLLLSPTEDPRELKTIASKLDGVLFAGGSDIAPALYGCENKGAVAPYIERDRFELALCREALEKNKPVLGICRGCQLLNVALGGTLIQHMPDLKPEWILHKRSDVIRGYVHDVIIKAPWLFPSAKGDTMRVNSMHHQAIDKLARKAEIAAVTEDGLIEAIWAPEYKFAAAVQWHPECLFEEDPVQAEIFAALIKKAKG